VGKNRLRASYSIAIYDGDFCPRGTISEKSAWAKSPQDRAMHCGSGLRFCPPYKAPRAALLCRQSYTGTACAQTRLLGMRSLVTLKFVCPATKQELRYRLQADAHTLVRRWAKSLKCRCPYCNGLHSFSFRTGYVDGMIAHVGLLAEPTQSLTRFLAR
jgi:hypothetical protein